MDVETLRILCLSLPAVTEDVKWQHDLVFSIGGKMFCVVSLEAPFRCSFKVRVDEFEELSAMEGFMPAPYMARAKWVSVIKPGVINHKQWEHYIKRSYEMVKQKLTKKLKIELGLI